MHLVLPTDRRRCITLFLGLLAASLGNAFPIDSLAAAPTTTAAAPAVPPERIVALLTAVAEERRRRAEIDAARVDDAYEQGDAPWWTLPLAPERTVDTLHKSRAVSRRIASNRAQEESGNDVLLHHWPDLLQGDGGSPATYLQVSQAMAAGDAIDLRHKNLRQAEQYARDWTYHRFAPQTFHGGNNLLSVAEAEALSAQCKSPSPDIMCPIYADFLRHRRMITAVTVALIHKDSLIEHGDNYRVDTSTVRERYGVCSNEPLIDARTPSVSHCTGVVIGPRRILTAAHCLDEFDGSTSNIRVVLGYQTNAGGTRTEFQKSSVFSVHRDPTDLPGDALLLTLPRDRRDNLPVTRFPLFASARPGEKTKLFTAGYPLGMPLNLCTFGTVRTVEGPSIYTDLDVFVGNSGSPVFNSFGELLGIVVAGEQDFVDGPKCKSIKRCQKTDACRLERVLSISDFVDDLRP